MNQRQRNEWIESAKEQVLRNASETDSCESDLMALYDECANGLENEIRAFYSKYASENKLTETAASKLLTGKEYRTWRKSLEGYLKDIQDSHDSKLILELNTLAAKSQITRKEQLLTNIYRNMANLAGRSDQELTGLLAGLVETNFERKSFDIQKIAGVTWNVAKVDERLLKQILSYPWSGKHYSEALWGNTDQLAALTRRELTLGFMAGSSVDKMAKEIDDVMGRGRYAAQRLVRTEASYFANQGQLLAYQDAGVEKYRFLGGGCEICQRLNGQVFPISEAKAGENLPPIHPNCKCTTVAAYDIPVFKRREGNPLKDNPKFEEWKRRHMEEADQADIGPDQEKPRGLLAGLKERKAAKDLLKPYAEQVKVIGDINLSNYKKAAAELKRQLAGTGMDKLDRIEVFGSQSEPGKMASARQKTLKLSDDLMNRPDRYYSGAVVNWQKRMERALGELRAQMRGDTTEGQRKQYAAYMELKRYIRGNVLYAGKEIECVVQHEMTHIILNDRKLNADKRLFECYNKAMATGDIYKISHRASTNEREFICEASVMYENGEPLPEYIRNLVKELRTYET